MAGGRNRSSCALRYPSHDPTPLAQYKVGDHIFEVKDKGSKLFPYILEDNSFRISLSKCLATSLPLAFVHVSSAYLASAGPTVIEADIRAVLEEVAAGEKEKGPGVSSAGVSRVDLFVDFAATWDMEDWSNTPLTASSQVGR